jgi:hypothetical protein
MQRADLEEKFDGLMAVLNSDCTPKDCKDCRHVRVGEFETWDCQLLYPIRNIPSLDNPICSLDDWRRAAQIDFVALIDEYDKFKEADAIITSLGAYISGKK